ncbi:MAG: PACE efflux transporter [Oceanospirillum sp.]|nr:PACE efflux transporter [Oceanospirillum sp.]
MADKKIMIRSGLDRIRYVLVFEVLLLLFLAPAIAFAFDKETTDTAALTLILAAKAMIINMIYNYFFDKFDAKRGVVPTERTGRQRVMHAIGLEVALTVTSLPIVTWWLDIAIWQALAMDALVMAFIVVYTMGYTWVYDRVFPVTQPEQDLFVSGETA